MEKNSRVHLRLSRSFLRSRREAILILASWAAFLVWTVGYSAVRGYGREIEDLEAILGMPDWIFWGVLIPWLAATGFSCWFGLAFMEDDPADGDRGAGPVPGSAGDGVFEDSPSTERR